MLLDLGNRNRNITIELLCYNAKPAAPVKEPTPEPKVQDVTEEVDDLDLDDLEIVASKPTLSKEASAGRTDADII